MISRLRLGLWDAGLHRAAFHVHMMWARWISLFPARSWGSRHHPTAFVSILRARPAFKRFIYARFLGG